MFDHFPKYKKIIAKSINYSEWPYDRHPLKLLLSNDKIKNKKDFLQIYLNMSEKCKVMIETQTLRDAINEAPNDCKEMIENYVKKNDILQ